MIPKLLSDESIGLWVLDRRHLSIDKSAWMNGWMRHIVKSDLSATGPHQSWSHRVYKIAIAIINAHCYFFFFLLFRLGVTTPPSPYSQHCPLWYLLSTCPLHYISELSHLLPSNTIPPLSSSFVFDQQWHSVHWHLVGRQHQSPYLLRWSACLIWELFYIEYPSWHNPPYLSRLGNTNSNTMVCFTSLVEPVMYQSLNRCGFKVHHCHSFTYLAKRTMLYLKASQDIVRCVQCWLLQVFSVDILLKFRIFHILKGPVAKRHKLRKL